MLTNASINAAVGTVAAWQRTPYALAPKPGSLLAKLCEHTRLDSLVSLNDIDNVDTERLYRDLHYVANGIDPMQMSDTEHSVVMDGTVEFLVGSMLSLAPLLTRSSKKLRNLSLVGINHLRSHRLKSGIHQNLL